MTGPNAKAATSAKKTSAKPAHLPSDRPISKIAILAEKLRSKDGATIEQLGAATGWQAHSIRGAIAGTLKKKHGLTVRSTKVDGVRTYRIVEAAEA